MSWALCRGHELGSPPQRSIPGGRLGWGLEATGEAGTESEGRSQLPRLDRPRGSQGPAVAERHLGQGESWAAWRCRCPRRRLGCCEDRQQWRRAAKGTLELGAGKGTLGAWEAWLQSEWPMCLSDPAPAPICGEACPGPSFTDKETEFQGAGPRDCASPWQGCNQLLLLAQVPAPGSQLLGEWQET